MTRKNAISHLGQMLHNYVRQRQGTHNGSEGATAEFFRLLHIRSEDMQLRIMNASIDYARFQLAMGREQFEGASNEG